MKMQLVSAIQLQELEEEERETAAAAAAKPADKPVKGDKGNCY